MRILLAAIDEGLAAAVYGIVGNMDARYRRAASHSR